MQFLNQLYHRDTTQAHRAATPLELLFDLVFVIAIASAASGLHHALLNQHLADGMLNFLVAFFSIWWGWVSFTWFASAFDSDDTLYRLMTLLQMFGAMVMAVGVPDLFATPSDMKLVVIGYAIMRLAMVGQWLRAGLSNPTLRTLCVRYAVGISLVQLLWIGRYLLIANNNPLVLPSVLVLIGLEMVIPIIAGRMPWHPHHIAERYSLLTIIVLGEGMVGVANTLKQALSIGHHWEQILPLGLGAMALIFSLWWLYFNQPYGNALEKEIAQTTPNKPISLAFGYLHFFIFASIAGVGVGISLIGDTLIADDGAVTPFFALCVLLSTTTIYLVAVAWLRLCILGKTWDNYLILGLAFISPILTLVVSTVMPIYGLIWLALLSPVLMIGYCQKFNHTKIASDNH